MAEKEGKDRSNLLALAIGVIVFAAVFFALRFFLTPKEQVVNGILVQNDNPRQAIGDALAPKTIVERLVVSSEGEVIPGRSSAAAEIASAISSENKNVTVQGSVRNEYCVNSNRERVDCKPANVVISYSTCNCVRVENNVVNVLGTDAWMLDNGPRLRGLLRWAIENK